MYLYYIYIIYIHTCIYIYMYIYIYHYLPPVKPFKSSSQRSTQRKTILFCCTKFVIAPVEGFHLVREMQECTTKFSK